jgi:hypothetical protein
MVTTASMAVAAKMHCKVVKERTSWTEDYTKTESMASWIVGGSAG